MKPEDIHLDDWQRILFGNISPLFLLEVFIRSLVVYVLLLAVVRWLGKRMSGQLTIMEMTVMITLGAIVSVPVQIYDRGILQGVLILLVALGLHRALNYFSFISSRGQAILYGKPTVLVKDGVLQLSDMQEVRISRQQLFSELRSKGVTNLGKLRRVYLEPAGSFSLIPAGSPKPGLPLFPPRDEGILKIQKQAGGTMVCTGCGTLSSSAAEKCANCRADQFINAVA